MNIDEAVKKGFLEEKKIILKPSPRGNSMGISDPKHMAYFQVDQGSTFFCLPRNARGDLVNIFTSEEEKKFFEEELGVDLSSSKPGNFFEKFTIKVTKDSALLANGEVFNMSDPMDNIRVRVLKAQPMIAPSWEDRKKRVEYRWALIDESKVTEKQEVEFDNQKEFWKLIGKNEETPKLRNLLKVYFGTIGSSKKISGNASKAVLNKEINTIFDNEKDRINFLKIAHDKSFDMKIFVLEAMKVKAIVKNGESSYSYAGDSQTYTFNEIANHLEELKKEDDDIYFKIKAQIEKNNKE